MSENKTRPTTRSVKKFIEGVEHTGRREDAFALLKLMEEITGEEAVIWGESIIGFGTCHYRYESGREGDMPLAGFSPRKANLVVYLIPGFDKRGTLLPRLGKHKTSKSCLYLGRLAGVDMKVLRLLIEESIERTLRHYPQ